jgi:hypothetical protein
MIWDISTFLMASADKGLVHRLLHEYKEGKGYRYLTSEWLREVFYHDIGKGLCLLEADCTPSQMIGDVPHRLHPFTEDR